jgi:sugar lactone lactonase YvrE
MGCTSGQLGPFGSVKSYLSRPLVNLLTNNYSNSFLNTTNFVAFDPSFFHIIGPSAKVEHIITANPSTSHEASCYIPTTKQLYYAAWGFGHGWQYLLNTTSNELKNITTSPPTYNAHGCVYFNGSIYVATDGGDGHYASIVKINPSTLAAETLINNFYQQPFLGFNDLDIDSNGNIWVTDSISAWVSQG